jgi:hypothetical protein
MGLEDINFMDITDPGHHRNDVYEDGRYFTIGGHGDANDPNYLLTKAKDGTPIYIPAVGDAILDPKNGWDRKKPIQALVCHGSKGGDDSFAGKLAQYLADRTGSAVTIISSPDNIAVGYNTIDYLFGGHSDPGPGGWQTIIKRPQMTPIPK